MILAIDTTDLHPQEALQIAQPLWVTLACALVLAVALGVACIMLSGRKRAKQVQHDDEEQHALPNSTDGWIARVNEVAGQYDSGKLSRDDAFAALAAIARSYASHMSGRALASNTLVDLRRPPRTGHAQNWDLLRQTVAALYPPEFANEDHPAARDVSVRQASDWVITLIERWK